MANNQISVKNGQMIVNAGHQLSTNCVTPCNGSSHATVVATGASDCSQFSGDYGSAFGTNGWQWGFNGGPGGPGVLQLNNCPDAWYAQLGTVFLGVAYGGSVASCLTSGIFGGANKWCKLPAGSISCSSGRPLGSFILPGLSSTRYPCSTGSATVNIT
jgi:hypothetical protein